MKSYVIIDLDGCIADDRRRQPLINPEATDPWATYHAGCDEDPLINEHILELAANHAPVFFTARPDSVRAKTLEWLEKVAGMQGGLLFMRANDCRKTSPDLKASFLEMLFRIGIPAREIACACDDRDDVLEMYKLHGIRTMKTIYPLEEK